VFQTFVSPLLCAKRLLCAKAFDTADTADTALALQPGQRLSVSVPQRGQMLLKVPQGVGAGQSILIEVAPSATMTATAKAAAPRSPMLRDLSFDGMLNYERKVRASMGKLHNRWQKVSRNALNLVKGTTLAAQEFDDANFIPVADAASEEGWDPKNPNGFAGSSPDDKNITGIPGYTYTTNGEQLGVEDQGEGYYQLKDPEHQQAYLKMLQTDCFGSSAKWRDHSNCAALIHRSHLYQNADPFRFSGAFGWNPPFPAGQNATNKAGAMPPDKTEYWNYGSDDDFSEASLWDGKKFLPPSPPTEEATPAAK
jgi:hypothetical protein